MFYYLSNIAIIMFEVFCCKIFFESFCDIPKEHKKWKKILLMALLVTAEFLCTLTLSQWLMIKQLVVILIVAVIMHFYYKISIGKSAVFSLFFNGLLLLMDYVVDTVNATIFTSEEMVGPGYQTTENLMVVFSKLILFLGILIIKNQFERKATGVLNEREWRRFLFFPGITIIIILVITMTFSNVENQAYANVLYVVALGMVGMNVYVYYLVNDIVKRDLELHDKKVYELQVKNQTEMYRSLSENFERQKSKSHEFKNHILCIEGLVKEQQYEELDKYVKEISENLSSERNAINTNHVIINAILNTKHQEAINKKIVFVCKVNDLSQINMKDEDVVILLANLLNNAIEACEKCEVKRVIKVKFTKDEENIVLSVKNTYAHALVYENGEIITSKAIMPEEHGVGINNIIKVVEKYNGSYVIQNDAEEFYFSILIPV